MRCYFISLLVCVAAISHAADELSSVMAVHQQLPGVKSGFYGGAGQGSDNNRIYTNRLAQVFMPVRSGAVKSVSFHSYATGGTGAPLRISITDTIDGAPGKVLASAFVDVKEFPSQVGRGHIITADFSFSDIALKAGKQYGLIFDSKDAPANYGIAGSYQSPYAGGSHFHWRREAWNKSKGDLFFTVMSRKPSKAEQVQYPEEDDESEPGIPAGYNRAVATRVFDKGMELIRLKKYTEGRDQILSSVESAAAWKDYGAAYWHMMELAREKCDAWPLTQNAEWYRKTIDLIELRSRNHPKWISHDLPNMIEALCEMETCYKASGFLGKAYLVHLEAEERWSELIRLNPKVISPGKSPLLMRGIYVNLLLDKEDHLRLSGKLELAEECLLEVIPLSKSLDENQSLSRAYNNYATLLNFMGRSVEGEIYNDKARALKGTGDAALIAELNDLRQSVDAEGPTEELVGQLRRLVQELSAAGRGNDALAAHRRLATVLYKLNKVNEAEKEFEAVIENARTRGFGVVLANAYLWRAKARLSVDPEAAEDDVLLALGHYRENGDKPKEYLAYKCYAQILYEQCRYSDALFMINEALRLLDFMGARWVKPDVLAIKAAVLLESGSRDQAEKVWQEALELIDVLPKYAPHRKLSVLRERLVYLASLNLLDEIASLRASTEQFISENDLSDYTVASYRSLDLSKVEVLGKKGRDVEHDIKMEPFYCGSRVKPGGKARTMLWLINPNSIDIKGSFSLSEPASFTQSSEGLIDVVIDDENSAGIDTHKLTLPAQSVVALKLLHTKPPAKVPGTVDLKWTGNTVLSSRWDMVSDAGGDQVRAKVNASMLLKNSFYNVPVFHEVPATEGGVEVPVDFCVNSSVPCRLELYDAETGELLGIDARGNGSFLDNGDTLAQDSNRSGWPDAFGKERQVLCYVYALKGQKQVDHIDISFNIRSGDDWLTIGTDRLIMDAGLKVDGEG